MAKSDPRATYIRQAIKEMVTHAGHNIERAFEEHGCSCSPLRQELKELNQEYEAKHNDINQRHTEERAQLAASNIGQRIIALKAEIYTIDKAEHPTLDKQAALARPFFQVWLYDHISVQDEGILTADMESLAAAYAADWYKGWRPGQTPVAK